MTQYTSHHRRRYQRDLLVWFAEMQAAYNRLLDGDRKRLERWEQEHLGDGITGTSDWPGWARYIRPRPVPPRPPHRPAYWHLNARKRTRR